MSGYTIGEIIVWLVLAAVLGFILGWLIRELMCRRQHHTTVPAAEQAGLAEPVAKATASSGAPAVESAGFANSAKPLADGKSPSADYPIKGNADSMIFHPPTSPSYERTIAEIWFKTEADAIAAGFRKPGRGGGKKAAKKERAIVPGRFPGSATPLEGGKAPSADYTIKGNENSMIYHSPASPSYERTIAETWFKSEADAVAAGFRKPRNM